MRTGKRPSCGIRIGNVAVDLAVVAFVVMIRFLFYVHDENFNPVRLDLNYATWSLLVDRWEMHNKKIKPKSEFNKTIRKLIGIKC